MHGYEVYISDDVRRHVESGCVHFSDAESEAGESVASDTTLVHPEDSGDVEPAANLRERRSARDELAENLDQESKVKRTAEYVLGMHRGQDITHMMEIIHHEYCGKVLLKLSSEFACNISKSANLVAVFSDYMYV